MVESDFNEEKYRENSIKQWENAADGWHKWLSVMAKWMKESTKEMLAMSKMKEGDKILDVAAGDGDQSFMAAKIVGPNGHILATDISTKLLTFASNSAQEKGLTNIETRIMDATELDLEDNSFDAVICRNGLMLMPSIPKVLSGIYRVLKPGGRLSFTVFSTPDKNPWISIAAMISMKKVGMSPPKKGTPGLFSLGAPGLLEQYLQETGFKEINIINKTESLEMTSARECVEFIKEVAGAIHVILAPLNEKEKDEVWDEITKALEKFEKDGTFISPSEFLIGSVLKTN